MESPKDSCSYEWTVESDLTDESFTLQGGNVTLTTTSVSKYSVSITETCAGKGEDELYRYFSGYVHSK